MSSLSTILKMADVIRQVVFLLFVGSTSAVSSSQNVWNFSPFSTKKKTQPLAPGRLGCRPFLWRLSCSTDATLSHIANVFQSWSTVAGYEEYTAGGFKPIRNREIFWRIIINVYVTKEAFKDSRIFNEAIVKSVLDWVHSWYSYLTNRPFPSSKNPLFRNEAKCKTFLVI